MKRFVLAIAAVAAIAAFAGCKDSNSKPTPPTPPPAPTVDTKGAVDNAKATATSALDSAKKTVEGVKAP